MIQTTSRLPVPSDTTAVENPIRFDGRILYLSADPACMRAQLAGEPMSLQRASPLRDDVSTDEITPVTVMLSYDDRLGQYPYVGFKSGDERPVGRDAIRNGGFGITVAGKRYGKGSSRESSPLAEQSAGIRLIVAESFERIYRQNCDNLGIFTTTDFSILDRIQAGQPIALAEFLESRDPLTQQIIRSGGLLAYSRGAQWPAMRRRADADADADAGSANRRPRTLVEKIIARHLHPSVPSAEPGDGVFIAADWRFSHDYFTGMAAHLMHRAVGKPAPLHDPASIIAFEDHLIYAAQSEPHVRDGLLPGVADLTRGHRAFTRDYPIRSHGRLPADTGLDGSEGICHAIVTEQYALPGQVVIGTDSHTTHAGALGCLAFGAGATDIANSWLTGYIRCSVPSTLRIEVDGRLRAGVTAKDLVLHLLSLDAVRGGAAIGMVFEYGGSAVRAMSIDERATLTNMVAELGGFTGIVEPDAMTIDFLRERRGIQFELEPWMRSDADAVYQDTIRIDASSLTSMLARPGDPGRGVAADALDAPIAIDIAYGGSCTAGKRGDFDAYYEVLQWGIEHGLTVAPGTQLFLQFGSMAVRQYCHDRGYLPLFEKTGVTMLMPGCGACANCGPGQSTRAEQVTISAINRNFPGRSGPGEVWLASPYTVAASALAGRIATFESLRQATASAGKCGSSYTSAQS